MRATEVTETVADVLHGLMGQMTGEPARVEIKTSRAMNMDLGSVRYEVRIVKKREKVS